MAKSAGTVKKQKNKKQNSCDKRERYKNEKHEKNTRSRHKRLSSSSLLINQLTYDFCRAVWQCGRQRIVVFVIVLLALFDQSGNAKLWQLNKVIKIGFKTKKIVAKSLESLTILIVIENLLRGFN